MNKRGLTSTEILAIIAIICVLIGLLLPVIKSARSIKNDTYTIIMYDNNGEVIKKYEECKNARTYNGGYKFTYKGSEYSISGKIEMIKNKKVENNSYE